MAKISAVVQSYYMWILLITVGYLFEGTFSDMGKISSQSIQNHFSSTSGSNFVTKNNTKIIAQKGGLAILPCAVRLNSPATVSWIRRKDFQLLTVGLSTHSSDGRFLVEHTRHMGHWALRIKSVKEEDKGFYECQLSIHPTQSIFVELRVVEAIAEISGAPDLHIDEGSTLRLECKLIRATENPSFVFWYHDNKMVNYDSQDGFFVTSTSVNNILNIGGAGSHSLNKINNNNSSNNNSNVNIFNKSHIHRHNINGNDNYDENLTNLFVTTQSQYLTTLSISTLGIHEVHFHHAGNYTCAPSNARSASITVHVLRGEKPAAMQHANRTLIEEIVKSSVSSIHLNSFKKTNYFKNILKIINLINLPIKLQIVLINIMLIIFYLNFINIVKSINLNIKYR